MSEYSRGRDLAGNHRDSNAKLSKMWYALSQMSFQEIWDELEKTQDRSYQTIRIWITDIAYYRRLAIANGSREADIPNESQNT